MSTETATVETLTAEVRVLMVGNRQVTLSVYRQLDRVFLSARLRQFEPFGRVRSGATATDGWGGRSRSEPAWLELVGRDGATGALVRVQIDHQYQLDDLPREAEDLPALVRGWASLPLIVLAGLR